MANIEHKSRMRLDHFLMEQYPEVSRGFLQKLCATDQVLVNNEPQKGGYKLHEIDKVRVLFDMQSIGKVPDIELDIVYEDSDCIVVDKPAGVLSHALSKFHGEPSVASFLRQRVLASDNKTWKAEDLRFGIVHRLDRLTSGLMICAKNQGMMRHLQKQFHDRTVTKVYKAVVDGIISEPEMMLDLPLERNPKAPATFRVGVRGKSASTHLKVMKTSSLYSLLELRPQTGRTHQLRVHVSHIMHPIVGDFLYGGSESSRLFLHAEQLHVPFPDGTIKEFHSQLPAEFEALVA